jgi:hypothetical protein
MSFKIHNLLKKDGDKASGPMSPVLFIQEMSEKLEGNFQGCARLMHEDSEVNQTYEGPGRKSGMTGYDTLITTERHGGGEIQAVMFVDQGTRGLPVGYMLKSNRELVMIPIYEKCEEFEKKLTPDEVGEILNQVLDNYDTLILPQ